MAAKGNHVKGLPIVVDLKRAGTLEQFIARERPAKAGPRKIRTTWECINCGNSIASTRGVSRCPRCGSIEVFRVDAPDAQHQQATPLHPGTIPPEDRDDESV